MPAVQNKFNNYYVLLKLVPQSDNALRCIWYYVKVVKLYHVYVSPIMEVQTTPRLFFKFQSYMGNQNVIMATSTAGIILFAYHRNETVMKLTIVQMDLMNWIVVSISKNITNNKNKYNLI